MKLVTHPPVEDARRKKIVSAADTMTVVNAADAAQAQAEIVDADAFFGKITPSLLAAATRLRWVQSATASLEHYVFPELVDHPCVLTNMRGLYSDIIADHVFGYVICFARNFHRYIRNQLEGRWAPAGDAGSTPDFQYGPGVATPCAFWRLIETGSCYRYSHPWYGAGCVDSTGRLVGLPSSFTSQYSYNGYMQLQIGCRSASGTQINWPGSCQPTSSVYS